MIIKIDSFITFVKKIYRINNNKNKTVVKEKTNLMQKHINLKKNIIKLLNV